MAASKIEEMIDIIEDYIDGCKFQTFSQNRIIVNKDQLDEFLRELRVATPDEIKTAQKVLHNRDAILTDAKTKAEALITEATNKTKELVNEHEIMQQAYARANEIVTLATNQAQEILDNAAEEANSVKAAAMQYVDELLANLEAIITRSTQLAVSNYDELIGNLNSCNGIVKANRSELHPKEDNLESIVLPDDGSQGGSLDII